MSTKTQPINPTPGPWYAMVAETGGLLDQAVIFSEHETDGEPTFIADTRGIDEEVPLEQRKANAYLLAGALALFIALEKAVAALRSSAGPEERQNAIRDGAEALALASGPR